MFEFTFFNKVLEYTRNKKITLEEGACHSHSSTRQMLRLFASTVARSFWFREIGAHIIQYHTNSTMCTLFWNPRYSASHFNFVGIYVYRCTSYIRLNIDKYVFPRVGFFNFIGLINIRIHNLLVRFLTK